MTSSQSSASVIVPAVPRPEGSPLAKVSHIIAIGSGKGGVGKSTTAVNLAVALQKLGAKVGLMDADIYGPSLPKLMGLRDVPIESNGKIAPPVIHGIKCMSMGLLGGDAPIVWRGPMASRAVSQFLSEVDWGELDYLIVDLPPGTGDIQLTLAQSIRLSAAIVVMTPQALASEIARRGLKMFQQVRVPVLGLVENMSEYECPKCHYKSHLFSQGGGDKVAQELSLPVLQRFPLDPLLLEDSDNGIPVVISRPDSSSAKLFFELAHNMAAELSTLVSGGRTEKPIVIATEPNEAHKMLKLSWNDGKHSIMAYKELRYLCPCAVCVDENTGVRKVRREDIRPDVHPSKIQTVGNYALGIHWSDGHNTGLYGFDYLRKILVSDSPSVSV
ncbi:MAG: P-loop NTPase [Bdellovibrionota bacterium]